MADEMSGDVLKTLSHISMIYEVHFRDLKIAHRASISFIRFFNKEFGLLLVRLFYSEAEQITDLYYLSDCQHVLEKEMALVVCISSHITLYLPSC